MSYDLWAIFPSSCSLEKTLRIRPVAHLIAEHQYSVSQPQIPLLIPHSLSVAHIFQLSKLADVQNLHICCSVLSSSSSSCVVFSSFSYPVLGLLAPCLLGLARPSVRGSVGISLSLTLAGICLPFRFGTICHWQAVILWLVSWVCLPVCPASLWTPTSARFPGSTSKELLSLSLSFSLDFSDSLSLFWSLLWDCVCVGVSGAASSLTDMWQALSLPVSRPVFFSIQCRGRKIIYFN